MTIIKTIGRNISKPPDWAGAGAGAWAIIIFCIGLSIILVLNKRAETLEASMLIASVYWDFYHF